MIDIEVLIARSPGFCSCIFIKLDSKIRKQLKNLKVHDKTIYLAMQS
jgi:hypothetical protein